MLAQERGRWAVSQKRIIITWGNFACIVFTLIASRHFYFVTLLILGLITDKMYMNIFTA